LVVLRNAKIAPEEVEPHTDELFVLDIRPAYSFKEAPIEGNHNLPIYDQLEGENSIGLDASTSEIPDDEEIVVVCFSGPTAAIAAE
jgi:rhodanese-related sulfurtransferase